jgi:Uma2 family endonuclease
MIDMGILTENHPLELIDGEVVYKADRRAVRLRGTATIERYPFTTAEYQRLLDAGIVTPGNRVALGDGDRREWMTIGDPHCACCDLLFEVLLLAIGQSGKVRVSNPIVLDTEEPEPDVSVVYRRADNYRAAKPRAGDSLLVVEVADTSLNYDRNIKGPLYARKGIPEYWIVDLNDDAVHVFRGPQSDGTWFSAQQFTRGGTLTIAALPGISLAINDILP